MQESDQSERMWVWGLGVQAFISCLLSAVLLDSLSKQNIFPQPSHVNAILILKVKAKSSIEFQVVNDFVFVIDWGKLCSISPDFILQMFIKTRAATHNFFRNSSKKDKSFIQSNLKIKYIYFVHIMRKNIYFKRLIFYFYLYSKYVHIFDLLALVSWRSENEPDFAGGWPGMCWLVWAERGERARSGWRDGKLVVVGWVRPRLASHPLEDRDRDMRLARLQSVDTGLVVTTVSPGAGVTSPVSGIGVTRSGISNKWRTGESEGLELSFWKCFSLRTYSVGHHYYQLSRERAKAKSCMILEWVKGDTLINLYKKSFNWE